MATMSGQSRTWVRAQRRPRRALFLSSPIGLGHARRDVAIAQELRRLQPDLQIDWLAQHPVTRVLADAGETVHPASAWLANESAHIEDESADHDLHAFQAIRRMDEILVNNFMVFNDVVDETYYDLVIGDEAWDVDYFLHENPELKTVRVRVDDRLRGVAADAERRGCRGRTDRRLQRRDARAAGAVPPAARPVDLRRQPRGRRSTSPSDPGLPGIRDWTTANYDFAGYVTGFAQPRRGSARARARATGPRAETTCCASSPSADRASAMRCCTG